VYVDIYIYIYICTKHRWIIKCIKISVLKNCRYCKVCSRCRCRYSCCRTLWYLQFL